MNQQNTRENITHSEHKHNVTRDTEKYTNQTTTYITLSIY